MRTRTLSTATALAVLFSSAALSVVTAGHAAAATAVVASPGGIVVDGGLKRVFVGDRTAGKVLAADYTGALTGSVSGIRGVSGLALSDDGATLYAAAEGSNEIVAIDAATLDVKARYAVPTDKGPRHIAFAGGKVWFTYGDQWDGNLGSLDPKDETVALGQFPAGPQGGLWGPALLDTDPSAPGLLAVGQTGLSTDSMAVVDVTGSTPQLTAWHNGDYTLNGGISDIDLVPGAPQVLVNGAQRDSYADGKFKAAGAYPAGQRADIAPNGLVAQVDGAKVSVYRPNAAQPVRTYANGASGTSGTAALRWAPDSSRIFALVEAGGGYTLKTLTDPTLNAPTLTVNAPSTATRGKELTVKGKITATVPLPSGTKLQATRTDLESPGGKVLPAVTAKADGSYSFTDTPPAGGKVTYQVAYAGDASHTTATASDKVDVSRTKATLTVNKNGKVYGYGADVSFTAHLGPTYKNRTVEIWANPYGGDKPNKLVKTGKVNSSGNISATVDMKRDTVVTAVYKGDARTAPKTAKSTAYAKVNISTSVSKHYKKAKIGSTPYYWFHKRTDPLLTTTMSYYKDRKQRFDLQIRSGGRWHSADSQYFPIGTNGKSAITLEGPGQSGIKARMRSTYVNGSSGDNVNSTTHGAWKYLYWSD